MGARCENCRRLAEQLAHLEQLVRIYERQAKRRASERRCIDCGNELPSVSLKGSRILGDRCPACRMVRQKVKHRLYMRTWIRRRRNTPQERWRVS